MSLPGIVTALQAAFEGINGAAPYTTNVKAVNGIKKNMLADAGLRPAVTFAIGKFRETDPDTTSGSLLTIPIEVQGWIEMTDAQRLNPLAALAALWTDLRTAIKADRTLGGNATDVRFKDHDFSAALGGNDAVTTLNIDVDMWDAT